MEAIMKTFKRATKLSFVLLSFFLLFVSQGDYLLSQEAENQPTLKIYYVPFDVQNFINTTMDTIENQSDLVIWIYDNDPLVAEIIDLLKGEKPSKEILDVPVEHLDLRLKVENVRDGSVSFVDAGGIVQTNKGSRFLLSQSQIEKLEAKIMSLRGIVHKNVDKSVKLGLR